MSTRAFRTRALALPVVAALAGGLLAGCSDGGPPPVVNDVQAGPVPGDRAPSSALRVSEDGLEVSYDGVAGTTALDLLVRLDPSAVVSGEGEKAFVTGIGGRDADPARNEFWAFYVNGEVASVGAGSYVTEDGDVITWKLETF